MTHISILSGSSPLLHSLHHQIKSVSEVNFKKKVFSLFSVIQMILSDLGLSGRPAASISLFYFPISFYFLIC